MRELVTLPLLRAAIAELDELAPDDGDDPSPAFVALTQAVERLAFAFALEAGARRSHAR
ncbi:MAG TPA: hypothetical protein VL131_05890 [Gammaproteobacteria bacterium]|nr:hypothetical protein [Gammaproteobacteria bacterium]